MRALGQVFQGAGPAAVAVALLWLGFCGVLYGASDALREAVQTSTSAGQVGARHLPGLAVSSRPLAEKDYRAIAAGIRSPESVVVKASAEGITVEANQLVDYENWRLVVDEVLLSNQAYRWQVKSLCAGDCPRLAFSASLGASESSVVVNQ